MGLVSHATDGTTTGALPLPRELDRILREDIALLEAQLGGAPGGSSGGPPLLAPTPTAAAASGDGVPGASGADGVHGLLEVLAPYWTSRLTIKKPHPHRLLFTAPPTATSAVISAAGADAVSSSPALASPAVSAASASSVQRYCSFYLSELNGKAEAGAGRPQQQQQQHTRSSSRSSTAGTTAAAVAATSATAAAASAAAGAALPRRSATQPFDRWTSAWAKFLLDQLMLNANGSCRESRLWDGFRVVVQVDTPTTLYLLPYLVRDVILLCGRGVVDAVRAEVMAVLSHGAGVGSGGGGTGGGDDGPAAAVGGDDALLEGAAGSAAAASSSLFTSGGSGNTPSGFHHRATQAVFSLLDTLGHWSTLPPPQGSSSGAAPPHRSRMSCVYGPAAAAAAAKAAASAAPLSSDAESLCAFIASISRSALADAAFRIHAFARAYLYQETHLRETRGGKYGSARILRGDVIEEGAVGGLVSGRVPYSRDELAYLQAMYANIDDPDGMAGIGALRSRLLIDESSQRGGRGGGVAVGGSMGLRERMIDFEHEARWGDALMCYEQALQESAGQPRPPLRGGSNSSTTAAAPATLDTISEEALHAGVLRCLRNVGHLETALHRAVGVLGSRPDLASVVTPHAVEAAWRLAQWQPLQRLLAFQGDGVTGTGTAGEAAPAPAMGWGAYSSTDQLGVGVPLGTTGGGGGGYEVGGWSTQQAAFAPPAHLQAQSQPLLVTPYRTTFDQKRLQLHPRCFHTAIHQLQITQ